MTKDAMVSATLNGPIGAGLSDTDWIEHLADSELFSACATDDLARVVAVASAEIAFEADDRLMSEGEIADCCYLIIEGEADVTVSGRYMSSVGSGDAIGEMGLVDGLARMATITARTPMRVRSIDAGRFDELLLASPTFCRGLLRQVSRRLRDLSSREVHLGSPAVRDPAAAAVAAAVTAGSDPSGGESVIDITSTEPPYLDPFEEGFWDRPHEQYRRIREAGVAKHPLVDAWMIAGFDDVQQVLRTPGLASVQIQNGGPSLLPEMERERILRTDGLGTRALLMVDPPEHTRLRRLVQPAFTPKAIRRAEDLTQALVDTAIDAAEQRGSIELIADFAFPIPFQMISALLGMPASADDDIRKYSGAITAMFDPFSTPEMQADADDAARWMVAFMSDVIDAKRAEPDDAILSTLIQMEDEGDRLTHQELIELVVTLYIAGHETTVHLIGNAVFQLLHNPDQWRQLLADPSLAANAVEEAIRFDSNPVLRRLITADIELGGQQIVAGDVALLCMAAANRDPLRWGPTADEFDITREGVNLHLGFGSGAHHCLGSSLARMEARTAISSLARRIPGLELVNELPVWNETMVVRGLRELPLRF